MSAKHTVVHKFQFDAANRVLESLREVISPEFLGLISTTGQPITVISSTHDLNPDALAALAAASFAASRQLAETMEQPGFTTMLQEGATLNINISQVTGNVLLLICFRDSSKIGQVRLMAGRAIDALAEAIGRETNGAD